MHITSHHTKAERHGRRKGEQERSLPWGNLLSRIAVDYLTIRIAPIEALARIDEKFGRKFDRMHQDEGRGAFTSGWGKSL